MNKLIKLAIVIAIACTLFCFTIPVKDCNDELFIQPYSFSSYRIMNSPVMEMVFTIDADLVTKKELKRSLNKLIVVDYNNEIEKYLLIKYVYNKEYHFYHLICL